MQKWSRARSSTLSIQRTTRVGEIIILMAEEPIPNIQPRNHKKYIMKNESVIIRNTYIHIFIHYIYIYTQMYVKIINEKDNIEEIKEG